MLSQEIEEVSQAEGQEANEKFIPKNNDDVHEAEVLIQKANLRKALKKQI